MSRLVGIAKLVKNLCLIHPTRRHCAELDLDFLDFFKIFEFCLVPHWLFFNVLLAAQVGPAAGLRAGAKECERSAAKIQHGHLGLQALPAGYGKAECFGPLHSGSEHHGWLAQGT